MTELAASFDGIVRESKVMPAIKNFLFVAGDFFTLEGLAERVNNNSVTWVVEQIKAYYRKYVHAPVTQFISAMGRMIFELALKGILKSKGLFKSSWLEPIKKIARTLGSILRNPLGFLNNLFDAVVAGFTQFRDNFLTKHIKDALFKWLFGTSSVRLPKKFDVHGLVSVVVRVLKGRIFALMRKDKRIGATKAARLEQLFEALLAELKRGGREVQKIVLSVFNAAKEGIKDWAITRIVEKAVVTLLGLVNPAGAVAQAALAIYNTLSFLVDKFAAIVSVVKAAFGSVASIAKGAIKDAANRVESTMAGTLPLIMGFLARQAGLGNVAEAVRNTINKLSAKVEELAIKLLRSIGRKLSRAKKSGKAKLAKAGAAGRAAVQKGVAWFKATFGFALRSGDKHEVVLSTEWQARAVAGEQNRRRLHQLPATRESGCRKSQKGPGVLEQCPFGRRCSQGRPASEGSQRLEQRRHQDQEEAKEQDDHTGHPQED